MSFLVQLFKLLVFAAVVLAAYAVYRPESVSRLYPPAAPYAQMAHAYLPAAITGEKPAAAAPPAAPPRPPVSVQVAQAERKTVPWTVTDIGTAQAVASVALRSHFDATVVKVSVADGAEVKAGDVLVILDDRQAQAQLAMAQAQLAKDEAQLEQAQRDVTRYTDLVARSATPVINLDNAKTASATSSAAIIGDAAAIRNMRRRARLVHDHRADLGPGRNGLDQGRQYRQGGDNSSSGVFATINQISPIYVALSVSQKLLPALREAMANGAKVVATPQGLDPQRRRQARPHRQFRRSDDRHDRHSTRSSTTPTRSLWPGQLCNLTLTLRKEPNTVVVPREAIQIGQNGNFVFTIATASRMCSRSRSRAPRTAKPS